MTSKRGAERRDKTMDRAKAEVAALARGEDLPPIRGKAPPRHIESNHQKALFRWRDMIVRQSPEHVLRFLHSSLNGAHLSATQHRVMKAEGMTAGVWDVCLDVFQNKKLELLPFCGLKIELKAPGREKEKNGGLTAEQVLFGVHYRSQGYCTVLAYSWDQARESIEAYLAGRFVPHQWEPKP